MSRAGVPSSIGKFWQEGYEEGLRLGAMDAYRYSLIVILRNKFGRLPSGMMRRIKAMDQLDLLEQWFGQALHAKHLDEVSITSERARRHMR
jgi:hypothetical protein